MVATFLSRWSNGPALQVDGWSASAVLLCCLILGPIAALVVTAFGDSGGLWSHLTYNEYPLNLTRLEIVDESGKRTRRDYGWARGNAEHAWGVLH